MIKSIAIVLVMLIANVLMVVAVLRAAKRVDYSLRRYFANRLGIEEGGFTLKIEKEVEESSEEQPEKQSSGNMMLPLADNVSSAEYKSKTLGKDYKTIKKISRYTPEYAVECTKHILATDKAKMDVPDYKSFLSMLDFDTVYELNTLDPVMQEELLAKNANQAQRQIIAEYKKEYGDNFSILDFYSYIQQMTDIYNSGFSVRVGENLSGKEELADGTKIITDENICEGSQVIYGGKMYDFSL